MISVSTVTIAPWSYLYQSELGAAITPWHCSYQPVPAAADLIKWGGGLIHQINPPPHLGTGIACPEMKCNEFTTELPSDRYFRSVILSFSCIGINVLMK